MKRSTKIILITAGICIAIGIILSAIAVALAGGNLDVLASPNLHYEAKELHMQTLPNHTEFVYEGNANNITLLPAEDNTLRVQYYESERDDFTLIPDGDTIRLTHKTNSIYNLFSTIQPPEVYKIVVYLPASITEIKLTSASGDIELSELTANELTAKTSSGDILLQESTLGTLSLKATSGYISLKSMTVEEDAVLETTSGNIRIAGGSLQAASIETTSGNVSMTETQKKHYLSCRSSSGNMNLVSTNYSEKDITDEMRETLIEIVTTSGNITVK